MPEFLVKAKNDLSNMNIHIPKSTIKEIITKEPQIAETIVPAFSIFKTEFICFIWLLMIFI